MAGDVLQCSLFPLSCFCLQFPCDRVRFIRNQSPEGLHKACWILAQGLLSPGSFCLGWSLAWFFTRAWQSSSQTTLGVGSQLGGHCWVTHAAFLGGDVCLNFCYLMFLCATFSSLWDSFSEPVLGALHHLGLWQGGCEGPPPRASCPSTLPCSTVSGGVGSPALLGTWASSELV